MKDEFPSVDNQDDLIADLISHIKLCDHIIKETQVGKQQSEERLAHLFSHKLDGAMTHTWRDHKITITRGYNYKFDEKKYKELLKAPEKIDPRFAIVKEVTKLELNKKAIRECDEFGSSQDKYLKSLFITTSDKKIHIAIKERKVESIADDIGSVDADGVWTPHDKTTSNF